MVRIAAADRSAQAADWAAKRRAAADRARALKEEREDIVPAAMRHKEPVKTRSKPTHSRRPCDRFEEQRRMSAHQRLIASAKPRVSTTRGSNRNPRSTTHLSMPNEEDQELIGEALDKIGSFFFGASVSPGSSQSSKELSGGSRQAAHTVQFYNVSKDVLEEEDEALQSPKYPGHRPPKHTDGKWGLQLQISTQAAQGEGPLSPAQKIQASMEQARASPVKRPAPKPQRSMRDSLEALHSFLPSVCHSEEEDSDHSDDTYASEEEQQPQHGEEEEGDGFPVQHRHDHSHESERGFNEEDLAKMASLAEGTQSMSDLQLLNRTSEMITAIEKKTECGTPQARRLDGARQLMEGLDKGVREGQVPAFSSISRVKGFQFGIDAPDWMAELGWSTTPKSPPKSPQKSPERVEYAPTSAAQRITAAQNKSVGASSSPVVIRAPPRSAAEIRSELLQVIRAPSRLSSTSPVNRPESRLEEAVAFGSRVRAEEAEEDVYSDDEFCSDPDE
eukprot:TRINITY_DN16172_c0_g1_i1.p1 TRINITY_DN16172_c0_g1~~TRINITY_DN16172_c0_g1_i1.p1  ORF type:complete len:503 (-),score=125.37 TRINITY_DN16172_c0_g1_i1:113-1621(-)